MVVDMKGSVKIALIIVGVIVILGLIFAAVYFNKLQTQDYKLNETNEENVNGQILEEIPEEYPLTQAIKDGCLVMGNRVYNMDSLNEFVENTRADNPNRQSDFLRIVMYTIEGDPVITELEYEKDGGYTLRTDNTRDAYGADPKVTVSSDIPSDIYTVELQEDGQAVNIVLQPKEGVSSEKYGPITIDGCSKEATIYGTAPTFEGEVTEVNDKSIVVKTDDQNLGDAVSVEVENAADYKVGDRVKVTYTGTVLETYPAQVYVVDVEKHQE